MSSVKQNKNKTKQNKNKTKLSLSTILKGGRPRRNRGNRQRRGIGNPLGPNSMRIAGIRGSGSIPGSWGTVTNASPNTRDLQVIEEDEYIGDVNGSVNFATTSYSCNPGQATTFPWGSKIAQLYEEYDFDYLEFYYTAEVSGYASQGQTGVVILSFDYDAADSAPTTKQQVENTKPHTIPCLPSTPVVRLVVDCSNARKCVAKYVRPGAAPANTDIKTYDIGNLYVTTQGQAGTTNIGELHVRYRCRFREPILEPASTVGGAVHFSSIAATTANNFAANALQSGGTPTLTGITLGTNTIIFPSGIPGNYLIALAVAGATSASALGSVVDTPLNILAQSAVRDATSNVQSLAGTTTSPAMQLITCTIPSAGATVTLTASTIVGTGTMDLFIVSLPSTVLTSSLPLSQTEQLVYNHKLLSRIARLEQILEKDSEFEDEEFKQIETPRICKHGKFYPCIACRIGLESPLQRSNSPVKELGEASVTSASGLSNSTVDLIGELIARKNANKLPSKL